MSIFLGKKEGVVSPLSLNGLMVYSKIVLSESKGVSEIKEVSELKKVSVLKKESVMLVGGLINAKSLFM